MKDKNSLRIGIDLGGTKIEIIVLENGVNEIYRKRIATPKGNYKATLDSICNLIFESEKVLNKKGSVGIGIPGSISSHTGLVKNANSTCLIGQPLKTDLENLLNREIHISNDANCMTISEATDGSAKDENIVFGVIIGTGTGGGISINKKILEGVNSISGEWGHNPLPWSNKEEEEEEVKCYCGKINCIETFLSGPGFVNRYKLLGGKENDPISILKNAKLNDSISIKALNMYFNYMAKALASVINILDPDIIVLAGGMSNIDQIYLEVPVLWKEYIFSDHVSTKLVKAHHGDSSGVRGAAWL